MKKRILSFFIAITMLAGVFAMSGISFARTSELVSASNNVLDGKKVLFVGCSFTYYGGTVRAAGDSTTGTNYEDYSQEKREYDNGFFYQLCKANGAEVNVTDWTFGGHTLSNILNDSGKCTYGSSKCNAGSPNGHLADLKDRNFDYVVLNEIRRDGESAQAIRDSIKGYVDIFKAANPNVKIYYIIHDGVYVSKYSETWLESVELIENMGVTILDWGTLVWDVVKGNTKVPGGTKDYRANTFMVSRSGDSYHPNILTGYLYALMAYCAMTGDTAVGQPYDFCYDPANPAYPISKRYEINTYKEAFYTLDNSATEFDERNTNFDEVLASSQDMAGLQQLVNTYLNDETDAWKKHIPEKQKRILFAGESMMYYGGMVLPDSKGTNVSTCKVGDRAGDKGMFYQLCKAKGLDISVTDWTFVGNNLTNLFSNAKCSSSYCSDLATNHLEELKKGGLDYDYIVFQESKNSSLKTADAWCNNLSDILNLFKEANPKVKFYYMIHYGLADASGRAYPSSWLESVAKIEDLGVTIIDSGTLVDEVIRGVKAVPGATKTYSKNSFIVHRSSTDGYHPNILHAYLDTVMIYSAITGESAADISYSTVQEVFEALAVADSRYDVIDNGVFKASSTSEYMKDKYKVSGTTTNFAAILNSKADVAGLNKLADEYLLNNAWLKYVKDAEGNAVSYSTITFNANDGSVSPQSFLMYGDMNGLIHDYPTFKNDGAEFVGWYAESPDKLWNFNTDKINGDITLYAAWKKIDARVSKLGSTYTVVTDISNIGLNTTIIIAGYKEDTLEFSALDIYNGENKTFTFTADIDTIKIMVWNMDTVYPMHKAKVINAGEI